MLTVIRLEHVMMVSVPHVQLNKLMSKHRVYKYRIHSQLIFCTAYYLIPIRVQNRHFDYQIQNFNITVHFMLTNTVCSPQDTILSTMSNASEMSFAVISNLLICCNYNYYNWNNNNNNCLYKQLTLLFMGNWEQDLLLITMLLFNNPNKIILNETQNI